jgi:MFS transporter, OFA family, oxalate/formate antiporter
LSTDKLLVRHHFFYGWVIVAVCALMIGVVFGLTYSYGLFFKPIAASFSSDRASVSLVFSVAVIIGGAISIYLGWLADRRNPARLLAFCGFMIGAGLILSSQVHALWQLFLTYGLVVAVGLQGTFGIAASIVSRWFVKNRGLALGLFASGSGVGTFVIVPVNERLINAYGWSQTFIIIGAASAILMIALSFLLRLPPPASPAEGEKTIPGRERSARAAGGAGLSLGRMIKDNSLLLSILIFVLFAFGSQMIIVHLVNYATDAGIEPLVAATFVSVIGAVSIAGRLTAGLIAEKIGVQNTLILTRILLTLSLICLALANSIWMFYLFAVFFAIGFGGEVTSGPVFMSTRYGTKAMAMLVNSLGFFLCIGGAVGVWAAGKMFDNTQSYYWAFMAGAIAAVASVILIVVIKIKDRRTAAGPV